MELACVSARCHLGFVDATEGCYGLRLGTDTRNADNPSIAWLTKNLLVNKHELIWSMERRQMQNAT